MQAQFLYSNIKQWHDAGIDGESVIVWNIESNTGHGEQTRSVISRVAPKATVLSQTTSLVMSGDNLVDFSINIDGKRIEVEEFISQNNVKIISSSLLSSSTAKEYVEKWGYLKKKYNLILLNCAGNDGEGDGETLNPRLPFEHAMLIGAVNLVKGAPVRAIYSSVGMEIDFTNFTLWFGGTSFSTPYTAGMVALLCQKYGDISHEEAYQILKQNSIDLGTGGADIYHGWGLPIMPDINTKYITLTIGSNVMTVDGQKMFLDTEPIIDGNGRTLVPVRAIAEALGCEVGWIPSEQKVTITGV